MLINNRQLSSLSNELPEALWRDFRQNTEHSMLSEHFAALLPHTSPRSSETGENQISDSVLGRLLELDKVNTGGEWAVEGATHLLPDVFA